MQHRSGLWILLILAIILAACAAPTPVPTPAPTAVPPTLEPIAPTPTSAEAPTPVPQRIPFNPGSATQAVQGNLAVVGVDRWVLNLAAGQTLQAQLIPNQGQVILAVWGADGTVLMSDHAGAPAFDGDIPSAQDYYIDVVNVAQNNVAYTLQVTAQTAAPAATATATLAPVPPTPVPQRLTFPAGSATIVMNGSLPVQALAPYVINLGANRTLQINATSNNGQPIITVVGADGVPLQTDHVGAATFNQVLPKTQDYYITVLNQGQSPLDYALQVYVPPLATRIPPTNTPVPVPPTPVVAPPIIDYFNLNPTTLNPGACLNMAWQTSGGTNAVQIKRNDALIYDSQPLAGQITECPPGAGNWTYRLIARNSAGLKQTRDVNVTVNSPAPQRLDLNGDWSDGGGFSFNLSEAIGCQQLPCGYTGSFTDFRGAGTPNNGTLSGSFDGASFSFSVSFEIPGAPNFQFNGSVNAQGTALSGNWNMGGEGGPVIFYKQ